MRERTSSTTTPGMILNVSSGFLSRNYLPLKYETWSFKRAQVTWVTSQLWIYVDEVVAIGLLQLFDNCLKCKTCCLLIYTRLYISIYSGRFTYWLLLFLLRFLCKYLIQHSFSAGFPVMHMSILYLIMGDQPWKSFLFSSRALFHFLPSA